MRGTEYTDFDVYSDVYLIGITYTHTYDNGSLSFVGMVGSREKVHANTCRNLKDYLEVVRNNTYRHTARLVWLSHHVMF